MWIYKIKVTCSNAFPSKFRRDLSVTGGTPRTRQVPFAASRGAEMTRGRFWTFLLVVTAWNGIIKLLAKFAGGINYIFEWLDDTHGLKIQKKVQEVLNFLIILGGSCLTPPMITHGLRF